VSDRSSCYCILDQQARFTAKGSCVYAEAYRQQFGARARAVIALEAGTHSRWMSALLRDAARVIVANPRRLRLLTQSDKKNDPQDARTLARDGVGPSRPAFAGRHRSQERNGSEPGAGADLLVEARTKLINGVRCLVKSVGARCGCASGQFTKQADLHLPEETASGWAVVGNHRRV